MSAPRRPPPPPVAGPRSCLLVALLVLAACGADHRSGADARRPPGGTPSVADAMSGEAAGGYARALEPRRFVFPADHLPHPDFRTEWWYLTGNLEAEDGRRFGYQLTFFRNALSPSPRSPTHRPGEAHPSAWVTRQGWLAHFALTDAAARRFVSAERLARGALGLAGAETGTVTADRGPALRVADWVIGPAPGPAAPGPAAAGWLPLRVEARDGGDAVKLLVEPGKPPVAHGEDGLSRKGGAPGNASFYYSFTRLPTRGTVTAGGRTFEVRGLSWMDREWSTSALAPGREGWDWFSIQLDDGRELMFYAVRIAAEAGGGLDPASSGTLVAEDGGTRTLALHDVEIEALGSWRSPRSGAVYPSGWRFVVRGGEGGEPIDLELTPILTDQELDVGFRYWEGAVEVVGTASGRPVGGRGYVELTGYQGGRDG